MVTSFRIYFPRHDSNHSPLAWKPPFEPYRIALSLHEIRLKLSFVEIRKRCTGQGIEGLFAGAVTVSTQTAGIPMSMGRTRVQCRQVVICVGRSASRRVQLSQHLTIDLIRAGLRQRIQIHDLARILVRQKFRFDETL